MKNYLILSFLVFSLFSAGKLTAQSNEMMDQFFTQDFADTGTSLLLIAQAGGYLSTNSTPEDAIQWASTQEWGSQFKGKGTGEVITSGPFHLALLESFSIKGGIMYSLMKTPRLAAREAGYKGILTGIPYVNHPMTPGEVLSSLTAVLEMQETLP